MTGPRRKPRRVDLGAVCDEWPSTRFGVNEWVAVFGVWPDVFNHILDDMAVLTGRRISRGLLRLDERGREIP